MHAPLVVVIEWKFATAHVTALAPLTAHGDFFLLITVLKFVGFLLSFISPGAFDA